MPLTTIYGGGTKIINTTVGNSGIIQTLHPDVMQFIGVLGTAATPYAMTVQEIDAINELVWGMEANGLWSKMQVVYPFIGSNSTAQSYNLKNTGTFQITWNTVASITFSTANGMQKTSTNTAHGNTNYTPSTSQTLNNAHLSIYLGTAQSGTIVPMAAFTSPDRWLQINSSPPALNANIIIQGASGVITSFALPATNTGFIIGSRTSSTSSKAYYNGRLAATNTTTATSNRPTVPVTIGIQNNNGTPNQFPCTQAIRFASIGTGLNDIEAKALTSIVQLYQSKLGRQV